MPVRPMMCGTDQIAGRIPGAGAVAQGRLGAGMMRSRPEFLAS
jgi:hypothetical protein